MPAKQVTPQELLEAHLRRRAQLMEADARMDFGYALEAGLTDAERLADEKLVAWRDEIANDHTYNTTIHNFF